MAELLVYAGTHWMEKLSQEEFATQQAKDPEAWNKKWLARHKHGDVIEIREDGFWGDGPYPRKDVFRVVKVPGPAKEYRYLLEADPNGIEQKRYKVKTGMAKEVATVATLKDFLVTDIKTATTLDGEAVLANRTSR